ncbi:MAG TPA: ABC transporter permease [Ruminiclostridium sp.]
MKNNFRGWTSVYAFTLRQATKGVGFKLVTAIITLLILGGFVLTNLLVAKPDKDSKLTPSPIKAVYVLDNSGIPPTNYKDFISQLGGKQFEHTEFVAVAEKSSTEVIKAAASNSTETIAVIITMKGSGYELKAVIPEGSKMKIKQAEDLLAPMSSAFQTSKLMQAGLSETQLGSVLKPQVVSSSVIGESTSEIAKAIKIVAPMLFSFILYFMLLLYGQNISKSVSTEKTSKLMDILLISVHPYAMITGKVLAITSMALGQFVTWIAATVAGLYGGNAIAHAFYPHYENSAITIINFLKDNIGETALTLPAVLLAVIFFCVGFLFYSIIAAVAGSMVSRPEDVASIQAVFQIPIILSWVVCYFAPITGNTGLQAAVRYIPFTAPFSVPVDLITGAIGLPEGIITLALLLVFSLLTIMLAARLYKGLVLYTGQKLSFKLLGNILKTNK